MDHLATTTYTSASRRRASVLAPPSPEPGKTCRYRACCSGHTGSRPAKFLKDQPTSARDQQPSPKIRTVDRKRQTCTTPTNTKIRLLYMPLSVFFSGRFAVISKIETRRGSLYPFGWSMGGPFYTFLYERGVLAPKHGAWEDLFIPFYTREVFWLPSQNDIAIF